MGPLFIKPGKGFYAQIGEYFSTIKKASRPNCCCNIKVYRHLTFKRQGVTSKNLHPIQAYHIGMINAFQLLFIPLLNLYHMPILQIVLVLVAVGVVLWLINRYIPMQGTIKNILNAVVVIITVIWLLKVFGVWDNLTHLRA